MAGLVPAIQVFILGCNGKDVDARGIGERNDAVLRTAMRGHDAGENANEKMTDFVYEICCTGSADHEGAVHAWAERDAAPAWVTLHGLTAVDIYQPLRGGTHDPFNNDGPGPLLMAILQFPTREKLEAGLADARFRQSLGGAPAGATITGTAFERRFYPVTGEPNPGPLRAPFSYVVRYHHPAENVEEFVAHYIADHPPILGKLPEIRSLLCYLPFASGAVSKILPAVDYMVGNEVVFDTPEAFNAAMASPVRHELRAHFHSFPKFTGKNTHYPMMRRQLASRFS